LPTSPTGLSRAQSWLQQRVSERTTLIVVEGTGSFGAIVTERLQRAGLSVEAARMPAGDRRGIGKNDELDATRIARAVRGLPLTSLRTPRELSSERARVAMRVIVVAREQMTGERTRTINTLTALVRTVDLGVDAPQPLTARQITMITAWRDHEEEATTATCRREAIRLARRVRTLDEDLARSRADITELIPGHPAAARAVRRRCGRCGQRAYCLVAPRASALRGRDGLAGRDLSDPSLLGQHRAASTQPRR
jgi:transposase